MSREILLAGKVDIIKTITVGIVAILLFSINMLPSINSKTIKIEKSSVISDKKAEVIIREYNGSGIYSEFRKTLSVDAIKRLYKDLTKAGDVDEKLELLKKYDLISHHVKIGKDQRYKDEISGRFGLFNNILSTGNTHYFLFNSFCDVKLAIWLVPALPIPIVNLAFGTSLFSGLLNALLFALHDNDGNFENFISSLDLFDIIFYWKIDPEKMACGMISTSGKMGEQSAWMFNFCTIGLAGFSGVCIYIPFIFMPFYFGGKSEVWMSTSLIIYIGNAVAVAAYPVLPDC
jgi:hypothetical protein